MLNGDYVHSIASSGSGVESRTPAEVASEDAADGPTLHDTRRALMNGVGVHEARVHAALVHDPKACGLDAIERVSGLDRKVLTGRPQRGTPGVIPAEGASSALLLCEQRGVFDIDEAERRAMVVRPLRYAAPNSSSGPHPVLTSIPITTKGGVGGDDLDDGHTASPNGGQMTSSGDAPWIERHAQLLAPDRELWGNRPLGNETVLGDAGWVLALVYGFEPVTMPMADVQRLLAKSAQQTQRIVDRLGFTRTKGRHAVVTIDLSGYASELAEQQQWYTRPGLRARKKAMAHHSKKKAVGRRGTAHGYAAYRIAQHRQAVAQLVADPVWRGWVLDLDEEALAEKLGKEADAGGLPQWALDLLHACQEHRRRGELVRPYVELLDEVQTQQDRDNLNRLISTFFDANISDRLFRIADTERVELDAQPKESPDETEAAGAQVRLAEMRERLNRPSSGLVMTEPSVLVQRRDPVEEQAIAKAWASARGELPIRPHRRRREATVDTTIPVGAPAVEVPQAPVGGSEVRQVEELRKAGTSREGAEAASVEANGGSRHMEEPESEVIHVSLNLLNAERAEEPAARRDSDEERDARWDAFWRAQQDTYEARQREREEQSLREYRARRKAEREAEEAQAALV